MAREDSFDIFGADPFGRDIIYGLSSGRDRLGLAPARYLEQGQDISQGTVKRKGYFGEIPTNDDSMMTEFSSAFEVGGKTVQYPLIVPTLTVDELRSVRDQNITPEINQKAQQFALDRLSRGLDPFATTQELRYPQPQGLNPAPSTDRMQATPRGFISGLFSDVLGGTFNMPQMPRTGVPSLDLLYANRNPLFNLMGVGDVQKTAERISYGEPLTTGQGMTTKPREETIFAGMAVAPFAPVAGRVAGRTGRAVGRMAGEEINAAMTGQPTRSILGAITPKPKQIFIGENAKTWNKAGAEQFLKLEESGVDPVDIWKQTGTFRSPDGKLRQEISDVSAFARYDLTPEQTARELDLTAQLTYGKPYQDLDRTTKNKLQKEVNDFQSSLNQNLIYEDLYRAYPELANIESTAEFGNIPRGRLEQTRVSSIGAGNVPVNERIVGERMTSKAPTEEELKSVLLHETQHAIQNRENFARGGSADFFKPNDVFSTEALEDAAVIDKLMRGSNLNQLEAKQRFEKIFNRSPEAGAFAALERVGTGKTLDAAAVSSRGASNPYKAYRSLAGEVEARAVQSRMNMTPEQRLETYPIQSYDVPVNQLIYADPFGNPLR